MDNIEEHVSRIEDVSTPLVTEFPFDLFERPENKTTRLIASSGNPQPIEGKKKPYKYYFKEPVFLSRLVINVTGYSPSDRFDVEAITIDGKVMSFSSGVTDDRVSVDIGEFCHKIAFQPPAAWMRSPVIQNVQLLGFKKADVPEFFRFAGELDDLKANALSDLEKARAGAQEVVDEADEARTRLVGLEEQISTAQASLSQTQADAKGASDDLNSIIAKSGATAKQLEGAEERVANLRGDIKIETQKKEGLQADIVAQETKLRELQANINLFPSEISGFVDQASSNSSLYLHYALGPMVVICGMFLMLILGAVDLTTVITTEKNVNLAAILVSRAPYVAVATAIIYASYRIAKVFITEVMHVNRQRLAMTKISIIAKDVSQAAEEGLNLSTSKLYSYRLKVKNGASQRPYSSPYRH